MGIVPDPNAGQGIVDTAMGWVGLGRKRPRVIDNPDDDSDDDDVSHRNKLPRVDPELFPPRVDRVAHAELVKLRHEDATRPVAVPADQVPADAEDVNNVRRAAPNPNEALFIEQNVPLRAPLQT